MFIQLGQFSLYMAELARPTEAKGAFKPRTPKKVFLIALIIGGLAFVAAPVSADINWTMITSLIDGMASNHQPSMGTLVTSAVPLLITLAIVGFVMAFLDRILDMLKLTK